MGFSAKQVKALRRNLDHRYLRTREANGRELSYIEGWYAISEANRIFGFDGWSRETVESRCVLARENRGAFLAVYTARVRISVQAGGTTIVREGHGSGEGRGASWRQTAQILLLLSSIEFCAKDCIPNERPHFRRVRRKHGRYPPFDFDPFLRSAARLR